MSDIEALRKQWFVDGDFLRRALSRWLQRPTSTARLLRKLKLSSLRHNCPLKNKSY